MSLIYIFLILWGYFHQPQGIMKRKDWRRSKDCWSKGWDFELHLLLRVGAMLTGGFLLSGEMYPAMWEELLTSTYPTTLQFFFIFFMFIFGMMFIRRYSFAQSMARTENAKLHYAKWYKKWRSTWSEEKKQIDYKMRRETRHLRKGR